MARYPALLRRTLPGEDGRVCGTGLFSVWPGGFVPYLGVYQIIRLFLERQADWEGIVFWCGVCLAGYAVKVAGYALSTMLAHVSAYTILEAFASRWQISS